MIKILLRFSLLFAILPTTLFAENLIKNPSFEDGFNAKGIASGWVDRSFGAKSTYSKESESPRSGLSCQKIECSEFAKRGGRMQFYQTFPLQKNKTTSVSIWLKSKGRLLVDVSFRRISKPTYNYALNSLTVTSDWQEFKFINMIGVDDAEATFSIMFSGVGVLYIDDVSVSVAEKIGFPAATFSPPTSIIPSTLFGMHYRPYDVDKGRTPANNSRPNPWPHIPAKTYRLHDAFVSWNWLERNKGEWSWDVMDAYVSNAIEHSADLIYVTGMSPTWASARPKETPIYGPTAMGCAAEPANMEDWKNYIRRLVTRYKGKIKYYEGWNEPNLLGFYSGSKAKMVELQKEMYLIVKEIDPAAQVISPSPASAGAGYLYEMLDLGLAKWCDAIGFHFYLGGSVPEVLSQNIDEIRKIMKSHGCENKPLINTEAGYVIASKLIKNVEPGLDAGRVLSIETAGNYIARYYLMNWSKNIPIFCYYSWRGKLGIQENNNTLKACGTAYQNIADWMTGAVMESSVRDEKGIHTVKLKRDQQISTIMWNAYTTVEVRLPQGIASITDIYGKAVDGSSGKIILGGTPILLK